MITNCQGVRKRYIILHFTKLYEHRKCNEARVKDQPGLKDSTYGDGNQVFLDKREYFETSFILLGCILCRLR